MSFKKKISSMLSGAATKILGQKTTMDNDKKEDRETKKIKFLPKSAPKPVEPFFTKDGTLVAKEKYSDPNVTSVAEEIGDEDFVPVVNGKGTFLITNKNLSFVLSISDNTSAHISKDENLLVLHMFENSKTKEKAIIFLTEQKKYLYVTEKYDEDFTVISEGTATDVLE
jgi:hypothetical protein